MSFIGSITSRLGREQNSQLTIPSCVFSAHVNDAIGETCDTLRGSLEALNSEKELIHILIYDYIQNNNCGNGVKNNKYITNILPFVNVDGKAYNMASYICHAVTKVIIYEASLKQASSINPSGIKILKGICGKKFLSTSISSVDTIHPELSALSKHCQTLEDITLGVMIAAKEIARISNDEEGYRILDSFGSPDNQKDSTNNSVGS